jgi:hypothetical protein
LSTSLCYSDTSIILPGGSYILGLDSDIHPFFSLIEDPIILPDGGHVLSLDSKGEPIFTNGAEYSMDLILIVIVVFICLE